MSPRKPILPGATIGILGAGQLGRMLALEAHRLGFGVAVFSPEANSPAAAVADRAVVAAFDDLTAIRAFAASVDVVTFEFENVPSAAALAATEAAPVHPDAHVLHTTQHRLREKAFLRAAGVPITPFAAIDTLESLVAAVSEIGLPAILKTAGFGYDGKGQQRLTAENVDPQALAAAHAALAGQPGVLEAFVPFDREISVLAARDAAGNVVCHPAFENRHAHHVLDTTVCPAALSPEQADEARRIATHIVDTLALVGVLCVEFFLHRDGRLLVNELAPRAHNSAHLTLDASDTSQFEQQIRAICGLPLGDASVPRPAAMANLLGDLWALGEPDWAAALAVPGVRLHLYGKRGARPGRKMGHLTAVADTGEAALSAVLEARRRLSVASP